jgi:hypothetical protein
MTADHTTVAMMAAATNVSFTAAIAVFGFARVGRSKCRRAPTRKNQLIVGARNGT